MSYYKQTLSRQFFAVLVLIFGIIAISLGLLLPKVLLPVYEKNIYLFLEQPLVLLESDVDTSSKFESKIAYLYINNDRHIVTSNNLSEIITIPPSQILKKIDGKQGKFVLHGQLFYYNTSIDTYGMKIALTDDSYILKIREDILYTIFPILFFTLLLVTGLVLLWSRRLIKKIEHLKEKVDNLDNDSYIDKVRFTVDDELLALSQSIDTVKEALKQQEDYKNQMYQNISHDFKTPITVIESYIEAMEDNVNEKEDCLRVIKDQLKKLNQKVHSLLYLNKLSYIKDLTVYKGQKVEVSEIIGASVQKFKLSRPDINWEIHIEDKKTIFNGTYDMWEAIVDNLLNNFVRYAEKYIKITIKNGRIIFYNDGPNIDPNILNDIFTPYKKGIKGQFGLGLSIVKKTIALFGYEIIVNNEKKGVSFIIK